jgi:hypothetical protein
MTGPPMGTAADGQSTIGARRAIHGSVVAGGLSALIAATAGLCCVGPLAIAVLGVGGAVAAAGLKPYRLPLLAVSFVLLATAIWRTLRPRATTTGGSCTLVVGRATRIGLWGAAIVWCAALVLYFLT